MHPTPTRACPCGAHPDYAACCGRWHAASQLPGPQTVSDGAGPPTAPDALSLMRSRYSAFVLDLEDYLLATWHASTRPQQVLDPAPAMRTQWLGLQIKGVVNLGADQASVEFVARFKQGGRAQRLHETSRFERLDGRWFYVDGEHR